MLFAGPPFGSTVLETSYVVVLFLACATAYAFFQVPFVAMPAEITDSYDERTRLLTWRVALLALTILVSGATAPAIRDALGGHAGYRAMGVFVGALILGGTLAAYFGTSRAPIGSVTAAGGGLGEQLRVVARVAQLPHAPRDVRAAGAGDRVDARGRRLRRPGGAGHSAASTYLFVCFVGPALLLTPLWALAGGRFGKKAGYVAASLVLATGALLLLLAQQVPTGRVYLATAVVGVGYAGAQMFPLSMLADVAAVDAGTTGLNRAGVFTGVWTAGETLGLAFGPGVFGVVLALGGYVSSTGGAASPSRTPRAPRSCSGFSLLPAVLTLVSLAVAAAVLADGGRHQGGSRVGPVRDVLARARAAAGARPADAWRPHAGLRLRLRAGRRRRGRTPGARVVRRTNGLDPTAFPSLLRMENDLVGHAAAAARCPAHGGRVGDLRRHRVVPARGADRARRAPRHRAPEHGAAEHRARCVPQGRPLLRGRPVLVAGRARDLRADAGGHGRGDRRRHRAGRGSAPSYAHGVVDPVPEIAAAAAARGHPLPRRRLHRRLGAAVRRAARP